MLKRLFFITLHFLFFSSLIAQGFSDNFSDGDFTANPIWSGDVSKFQIDASNQLQLNDVGAASPAYIATTSSVISNATWEFYVHLDFAPSTSNYASVYLVSDNADLTALLSGYYVKIGGVSGTIDDVSLYRQNGSSSTLLIDGTDGTVGLDPVDLKIKITRDSVGKWELFTDLTSTGNSYNSEGIFIDNSISQSQYFGITCNYTSTRSDKFFFDDFVVTGQAFQDTTPPIANSIQVININEVEILFNEKLEPLSANSIANYTSNKGLGNPITAAIQTDSTKVRLTFASNFVNGEEYDLEIQNVQDQNGNSIQKDTLEFLYFIPVAASNRDIVINEFMADYSPVVQLPQAEFIELYNASSKVFDLNNWTIEDASSSVSLTNYLLKPGDYVIVCTQANEALFKPFGEVLTLASLPSLNNSGDQIILGDPSSNVIDRLAYDLTWYNDFTKELGGWTLEQINPFTSCVGKNNFTASNSSTGGTPGVQNSVFDTLPDLTGPELLSATIISSDSILLNFNEFLDSTSTTLPSNYSFNTNAQVAQARNQPSEYTQVLLILSTRLDSGLINTITVNNIKDCAGNSISTNNQAEMVIPGVPSYRDVVINEIFADPSPQIGLPDAEFLEIYNASNKIFDLSDWKIGDQSTQSTLEQVIFSPGDFLIICSKGSEAAYTSFGSTQGQSSFASLGNSGDNLILLDNKGNIIDQVIYSDSWYGNNVKKDGGYTLEQINPLKPCTGKNNFIASSSNTGGTPGQNNSVLNTNPDVVGPVIIEALVISKDSIIMVFDEVLNQASMDTSEFVFSDGNMALSQNIIGVEQSSISIKLLDTLVPGIIVNISISGIADCSGNLIGSNSTSIALPQKSLAQDIVINEVLFNPKTGGSDFVELYNRSDKIVSLEKWQLANSAGDSISNRTEFFDKAVLLYPGEYMVITENKDYVVSAYPNSRASRIYEVNDIPSYNDDEGTFYLFNNEEVLVDFFSYSDDMHFSLLKSDDGVTLERVDPNRGTNEQGNFQSAAENEGFGTPGYLNSQYFASTSFSGDLTIDPELFTPNNDGIKDIVNFNYQFNSPGYVANVTIYDEQGRLIRELVKNELLGSKGTFTWDGTNEDGNKSRIGIYIIFFEAFNLSGNKEVYKKTCVLGGNL